LRSARHLSGILTHLRGQVHRQGAFDTERDYIHFYNGVLVIKADDLELHPFSPSLVNRNLIPITFDQKARCRRFRDELLAPLCEADREILQKLFGMFLAGINSLHKILILQGQPESGKSQLAISIREIIGSKNCAELRTYLLHDRFEIGSFLGRTLLIGADVANDFLNHRGTERLKALTGGDHFSAEKKG
jgi:phage/plasmid-associated DNA primase